MLLGAPVETTTANTPYNSSAGVPFSCQLPQALESVLSALNSLIIYISR